MMLLYTALYSILLLFYATPIELGGLSLDPPRIGAIFAISGFTHGTFQLLFYTRLYDRFGAYAINVAGLGSIIPVIILLPVMNALARVHGVGWAVWLFIGVQFALIILFSMCDSCMAFFIRAAAPNSASLGATNGIVQLVAAGTKIIGPASAASVFSYSMQEGRDVWLAYYFLMTIAFLAVTHLLSSPRATMIALQDDDEDGMPLLQRPEQPPMAKTPLPWDQFWIVLFLQISDPLVFETISPFVPQLIRDIGVTHGDESQVGYYVGILHSSYYVAQTLTILYWSQLSDRIGRKPLILTALFTIAVTMLSFGLSRTFVGLLVSRIICGAFNGENGVVKSMVMDITDATNLANAYGYMPLPWMSAAIIGALFQQFFASMAWLVSYFYLKEVSVILNILYLDHTNTERGNESVSTRAPPWELVKGWLLGQSYAKPSTPPSNARASSGEANSEEDPSEPVPLRGLANSEGPDRNSKLWHHGTLAFAHGTFQLLFYARLHDRFGAYAIHVAGLGSGIPMVILFPVINSFGSSPWCGLGGVVVHRRSTRADGYLGHVLPAAAPNRASLGATNGIAQFVAAGARIIGPASAASIFSYSMQQGRDAWLAYYFFMAMAFLAVGIALLLPRDPSLWEEETPIHSTLSSKAIIKNEIYMLMDSVGCSAGVPIPKELEGRPEYPGASISVSSTPYWSLGTGWR
ncbi:uncharacterized protein EDB91DRAFT_1086080 [Suillus paluster]|uniref:uncharacterized protein n=1 Tax=Suillus paluster TaxID=48578 RepID=UPI001B87AF70|nr:uncharacterized protein EDB91DRAFT_1086080 [Suillus paluster]KAG1728516.1 hypothetical protein EDB91DRAFT_1086080 [Suillus paluster]